MEDYDVFNEMQKLNDRQVIVVVEDDEDFITQNLFNLNSVEVMPIRHNYDLSNFSNDYVEKTKTLFTYYYNENNSYENEMLKLKKHFIHYQRKPKYAYIPNSDKYTNLKKMLTVLGVKCISNKKQLLFEINRKLILIDSDGTLKKSDGTISKRAKKAICNNQKAGNIVIICTARPRYHTLEVMRDSDANCIVVSSNGAEIYDSLKQEILFNSFIDKKLVIKLVEDAFANDIRLILTTENIEYVTKEVRNPKQILLNNTNYVNELSECDIKQCMFIDEKKDKIYMEKEVISHISELHIVDEISENSSYYEKWFSVANVRCSKGNALNFLSDYLNIPIKNTIAIGNDKNDISMFKTAGLSVAVANASDDIKSKVDHITLSNDEDGVAIFLETLIK